MFCLQKSNFYVITNKDKSQEKYESDLRHLKTSFKIKYKIQL